jgi:hypothetical protein
LDSNFNLLWDKFLIVGSRLGRVTWSLIVEAFRISMVLYKVMVPVLIFTKILGAVGGIRFLGNFLSPVMGIVGLPGSMGLVWATSMTTGIYGAMLVFATLAPQTPMSVAQVTVLFGLCLEAHNLLIEISIGQKAGLRVWYQAVLRIGGALLYSWLLFKIFTLGHFLQTPNRMALKPVAIDATLLVWIQAQVENLLTIFLIILGLLSLLKVMEKLGVTALLIRMLEPVLKLLGISNKAAPVTIIGMTLGLGLGGALVIREAQSGNMSRRDVFFSISLMCLLHSLIEDTVAILATGADLSGVLWIRMPFALVMIFILVRAFRNVPDAVYERYFLRAAKEPPENLAVSQI